MTDVVGMSEWHQSGELPRRACLYYQLAVLICCFANWDSVCLLPTYPTSLRIIVASHVMYVFENLGGGRKIKLSLEINLSQKLPDLAG